MTVPKTEDICEQLREFLFRRLELEEIRPEDVPYDKDLFESGTIDSIDALELIIGFEEEFEFVVPDTVEDLSDFSSLQGMAQFLEQEMSCELLERAFGGVRS